MLAFIARDVAGWLGIPAGIVIAAMVMLRKQGKQLRGRRVQQRARENPAPLE